jgi:excisionase family DNA binding protein
MKQIEITEENGTIITKVENMTRIEIVGMLQVVLHDVLNNSKPVSEPTKDLLNTEEAIKLLRCSKRTIQNWRKEKRIPFKTIGGKLYYAKEDLLKLIK